MKCEKSAGKTSFRNSRSGTITPIVLALLAGFVFIFLAVLSLRTTRGIAAQIETINQRRYARAVCTSAINEACYLLEEAMNSPSASGDGWYEALRSGNTSYSETFSLSYIDQLDLKFAEIGEVEVEFVEENTTAGFTAGVLKFTISVEVKSPLGVTATETVTEKRKFGPKIDENGISLTTLLVARKPVMRIRES